jgi:hypothetical protein
MPEEAFGTAKIINFFDKLFDSVNGGTLHQHYRKPLSGGAHKTSGHIEFWKESIQNLSNMYFVHQDGKKFVPSSLTNWIRTL